MLTPPSVWWAPPEEASRTGNTHPAIALDVRAARR